MNISKDQKTCVSTIKDIEVVLSKNRESLSNEDIRLLETSRDRLKDLKKSLKYSSSKSFTASDIIDLAKIVLDLVAIFMNCNL